MKIPSPYALYNIRYHWGLVKLLYIYITHSYYMRCRSVLSKIKRGPIALPCLANFYYIHINNYIYGSYKHIIYTYSFTLPFLPFFQLAWVRSDRRRKALEEGRRLARAEAFGTAGPCFFSMGKSSKHPECSSHEQSPDYPTLLALMSCWRLLLPGSLGDGASE